MQMIFHFKCACKPIHLRLWARMNGHLSDCSYELQTKMAKKSSSCKTNTTAWLTGLLRKVYFQRKCLEAVACMLRDIFQMVDTPSYAKPTHLSFLWADRRGVCSQHQLFSNWHIGGDTLPTSPCPRPFPRSPQGTPSRLEPPLFPHTIPLSGWLVFTASSSTKETKEAGPLSLSFPSAESSKRGGFKTYRPSLSKLQRPSTAKESAGNHSSLGCCKIVQNIV